MIFLSLSLFITGYDDVIACHLTTDPRLFGVSICKIYSNDLTEFKVNKLLEMSNSVALSVSPILPNQS